MKKVACDQFLWSPFILSLFFTYNTLYDGGGASDAQVVIRERMFPTLQVNWAMWIPTQLVNLYLVPPHRWILVINTVAVPWNTYLAYTTFHASQQLRLG